MSFAAFASGGGSAVVITYAAGSAAGEGGVIAPLDAPGTPTEGPVACVRPSPHTARTADALLRAAGAIAMGTQP